MPDPDPRLARAADRSCRWPNGRLTMMPTECGPVLLANSGPETRPVPLSLSASETVFVSPQASPAVGVCRQIPAAILSRHEA